MQEFNVNEIARVCHEANRAYCINLGDTSQSSWDEAPEWQRISANTGVNFHLNALQTGDHKSPEESQAVARVQGDQVGDQEPVEEHQRDHHGSV